MKCEDFLTRLETGGPLQRAAARRHAATCAECAAALAGLNAMKRQLTIVEPLSPRDKQLWARASEDAAAARSNWRLAFPLAAGMAGAAIVVLLLINLAIHWHVAKPGPGQVAHIDQSRPTVETFDPSVELSRLDVDARNLDQKLADLRQRAQRRDAQREVAMVYQHYSHW
jgi:hypothetical protein